ncbi:hypothetical protein [Kineosporia babensis]|uniref:Uncharacterized protein n=1 Tax=Kineosporia babensis TaxID=499548 RepID=A0A9X1NGN3_9ACTN|nr:hypothetical protein [Kineosporia babensis]MCD5313778.1 hypothetical protein [Kineosporia babensis]
MNEQATERPLPVWVVALVLALTLVQNLFFGFVLLMAILMSTVDCGPVSAIPGWFCNTDLNTALALTPLLSGVVGAGVVGISLAVRTHRGLLTSVGYLIALMGLLIPWTLLDSAMNAS